MENNNIEFVVSKPHIPTLQGEQVWGAITNVTITTFVFMVLVLIVSILWNRALKKPKSRLKEFFINIVSFFDWYLVTSFGWDKEFARKYLPLVVWIFLIVLFWNLFWLMIDWIGSSIHPIVLHYFRPIFSDINSTIVIALITVVMFLKIALSTRWVVKTTKWYIFNFTWKSFWEKVINVFVWWLHLIWIPSTLASLSLRLFGNIFAWIILVWVIGYLWAMSSSFFNLWETGRLFALPFWFFELFVAFVQAAVFAGLMIAYFGQSKEAEH